MSGGGRRKLGPWTSVSVYGMRSTAWKTLWILQVSGRSSLYVRGAKTSEILNGPSRFGAIFVWYLVFRFRVSSQTSCPFLNGVNRFFRRSAIRFLANSCAAIASSLSLVRVLIQSSIAGNLVFSKDRGIAIRVTPRMSSKGVLCRSECLRLLCVNSIVPINWFQVSGFEEQ